VRGRFVVDADKSVSHRALLIGALARGATRISNLLDSEDCRATRRAIRQLGVGVRETGDETIVSGRGLRGLAPAAGEIDCGNSGTTMRLLAGVLAGQPFESTLTGDVSLSRRPMDRIILPLREMGARITGSEDSRPPIHISGGDLTGKSHSLPIASAQVKSCLLLAGLLASGSTSVSEPAASRDHTERMLGYFGVDVETDGNRHTVRGDDQPLGREVTVPADISSAAFFIVAALLLDGSDAILPSVGTNPTRSGALEVLRAMGGQIRLLDERLLGPEPVADVQAGRSRLEGALIRGEIVPRLIDEIPIIAVAATQASGKTTIADASELRVKESDRIAAIVAELGKMGARIDPRPDGMVVDGPTRLRGARVDSHGDHRIAMALAIAGSLADGKTTISGAECIRISFPGFVRLLPRFAMVDVDE